jgi:hypothetical protein
MYSCRIRPLPPTPPVCFTSGTNLREFDCCKRRINFFENTSALMLPSALSMLL